MRTINVCPGEATWHRLAAGRVPEWEAEPLEEHLRECAECAAVHDAHFTPLIAALRSREPVSAFPEQMEIDDLMARLEGLVPPAGACDRATPDTEGGSDSHPLLEEPEVADEISRLGPYKVLHVLGRGGMGTVYEGEDEVLHRRVALKVIKSAGVRSASLRQRFLREARAAAGLDHDNVVPIWHVGEHDGAPFIAMPLLRGETLAARLKREPRLPVPLVLQIGREAAEGLQAAHKRGLTHRDVKPANLWLEERGDGVRVRVLDFGLARAEREAMGLSEEGALLGTPQYMAPEQARGEAVDARADLFGLGCVLYECLAGRRPFDGPSVLAVLSALENSEPRPPHELDAEVPRGLSDLVMRLLRKGRDERPGSAAEVVEALRLFDRYAGASCLETGGARGRTRRGLLIAALAAGAVGLALVAVVIVRMWTSDGKVTEVKAPGGSVVLVSGDAAAIVTPGSKAAANAAPPEVPERIRALFSGVAGECNLGSPTGEYKRRGSAWYRNFEKGRIYHSEQRGTFGVPGSADDADTFLNVYLRADDGQGLGLPTSNLVVLADGASRQSFEHGFIYRTNRAPVAAILGDRGDPNTFLGRFLAAGGEGVLGAATGRAVDYDGHRYQNFQRGRIFYTPQTGAHAVLGDANQPATFLGAWSRSGNKKAGLGLPTDEVRRGKGYVWQRFQKGLMYQPDEGRPQAVLGDRLDPQAVHRSRGPGKGGKSQ